MNYLISTRLTITIVWMTLVSLKVGFSYPSKRDSNDSGNGQIICQRPLGLSHNINSTLVQSTLSATQGNGNDARLHGPKSWIASRMDDNTYLQVNFSEPIIATGILIQGDPELSEWVSSFTVSYSMGCERFSPVIDNGSTQVFAGNLDPNSVAVVEFNNVYVAQCIRIIPTERHGNKSAMRVELLGCVDRTCTNTLATNWNVNRVQNMMELRFPSEKIVSDIAILPREEVWSNNRYTISYSRSCTNYRDVKENGNTQTYVSTDGGPILIDFGTQPLRVLCLRISALDSDFQDSIDIQIQLSGCAPLESCGHTRHKNRSRRQKRVIGGNHAAPGQWPWLVSMHFLPYHDFSNKSGYQHLCGATLIHPQWVLSAAHCYDENVGHNLSNNENWRAYVGEHNLNGREGTEQVFRIAKIIKHDNFQIAANSPILQDLALLKLDRPVVLSDYVNTICLAANNSFPPGTPCVAAGWGQNSLTGAGVKLPLHVELPILHSTECNRRYNSLPDDHEVKNHVSIVDSVLCAASENGNKDSCFGDSGGPLVCRTGDYWTQVGVVSFGYGCGDTNFPGVYTKVSYYINWITSKIQAETASVSNWNSWMHQSHSSSRDNILKP